MTLAPSTCPSCGTENAPGVKFCAECGTKLGTPREPTREVRKLVTVLFADVTGSTALGEQLDPETLRAVMARYFAMIKRVIERHGGTVEKFIGDAVMAVFGIPVVHEDDALRAVRAAAEIQVELGTLNAELEASRGIAIRFRTGVNTGEVVAGDPTADATIVTGDTVNTAARLEQHAPPGEILLGGLTYRLVRDAVEVEPVEPIAAKGKAEPVAAFRLVAVKAGAAGHARRLDTPLVGRERELRRLHQAFDDALADRSCQLFTLLGTAGVGKSRLVAEFLNGVGGGSTISRGRCLPYGEGITYWPIGEIVRSAAGIDEADTGDEARAKISAIVEGERDSDVIAARVAAAIGLSNDPAPQDELFWAIRQLLERLARDRPAVVVIEDIHWAEPTLLDLIEHIADWSRDAPLLLLCPARPELLDTRPGWGGGKLNASTLLLEPLPATATEELIAAIPGGSSLPPDVVKRIESAAEGNPLYIEEFLGMLVDERLLSETGDGRWVAAVGVADVTVPASISALLAARLEQLAPPERKVAERASVVGRVFEAEAVTELADETLRPEVRRSILALVRKELVRPDRSQLTAGEAFKFRHILIRDAAYETLPKAERAELHQRFADWLARTNREGVIELDEIIGHHYAEAHRYLTELGESGDRVDTLASRAVVRLVAAGRRALERGDAGSAIRLLRAATAMQPTSTDLDGARLDLAQALADAGRWEESRSLASDVAARGRASGNLVLEARAVVLGLNLETAGGRAPITTTYRDRLEAARRLVEASNDTSAQSTYWRIVSDVEWITDRFAASVEAADRALALAQSAGNIREADAARINRSIAIVSGPEPVPTARAELETMLRDHGSTILTRVELLQSLGILAAASGAWDDGRAHVTEALRLIESFGQLGRIPDNHRISAWIERLAGDYAAEIAFADLAVKAFEGRSASASAYGVVLESSRALALAKVGRIAEARAGVERADVVLAEGWPARLRDQAWARILAAEGRHDEAAERARIVEAAARDIQFPFAQAEALIESGVVALMLRDEGAAERRGRKALEAALSKQSIAHQRKAEALLARDISNL